MSLFSDIDMEWHAQVHVMTLFCMFMFLDLVHAVTTLSRVHDQDKTMMWHARTHVHAMNTLGLVHVHAMNPMKPSPGPVVVQQPACRPPHAPMCSKARRVAPP
jgi:hypothetical protein